MNEPLSQSGVELFADIPERNTSDVVVLDVGDALCEHDELPAVHPLVGQRATLVGAGLAILMTDSAHFCH